MTFGSNISHHMLGHSLTPLRKKINFLKTKKIIFEYLQIKMEIASEKQIRWCVSFDDVLNRNGWRMRVLVTIYVFVRRRQ